MDLNRAQIIGNITRDVELRQTPNGQSVVTLGIATNYRYNDSAGQRQEMTEWHNVVLWRRLAEIAGQYLKKGDKVFIEGRLQTRSWEDQQGQKRYTTEIIGDNMIMLGKTEGGAAPSAPMPSSTPAQPTSSPKPAATAAADDVIDVNDLPF
ncbi:MAG: single-stranded DNA-binding protein [Patescibacteria group bacterium]|nr:single-stranded DNA-binding protein [Patescibacteria group bacterium]